MRTARLVGLLLFAWLAGTSAASAGIRSSFSLECCAWNASHIVVATEGERIDGVLEVVESLHGGLGRGERLELPELALFAEEKQRIIHAWPGSPDDLDPKPVTGLRMVLFLKASPPAPAGVAGGEGVRMGPDCWKPAAGWGGMKMSVVWIERGRVYALVQVQNPGPSILIFLRLDEEQFRERLASILMLRGELAHAVAEPDRARRA